MNDLYNIQFERAKKADDPVGVSIKGEDIIVYIPQAFRLEDDIKKRNRSILLLLESISYGCKKNKEIGTTNELKAGEIWPLDSYIWIINDYMENGLYYSREKYILNNINGKIDWKKTMKTTPYINNKNVVYTNIYSSHIKSISSQITEIYKYCLNVSLQRIGWLFNYKMKIDYKINMYSSEMKHIVYGQLNQTFDDAKRIRLQHMIHILDNILDSDTKSNNHTFIVNNYENVFEVMIDELLGNVKGNDKKLYNPRGIWKINNNQENAKSSLRVDTIHNLMIDNQKITIIFDAKLYSYGMTGNLLDLPATDSIQKQITYGDHVKNVVENGYNIKIRNVFVSPYDKFQNPFHATENFYFYGNAYGGWRRNSIDYETIIGLLIDFNYLLAKYKGNTNLEDLFLQIINQI